MKQIYKNLTINYTLNWNKIEITSKCLCALGKTQQPCSTLSEAWHLLHKHQFYRGEIAYAQELFVQRFYRKRQKNNAIIGNTDETGIMVTTTIVSNKLNGFQCSGHFYR